MNRHEFQNVARQFRAGKISISKFTDRVLGTTGKPGTGDIGRLAESCLSRLKDRKPDSHKGDFGRVLVVAGSPGMAGAAALTGLSALRSGAGLVTIATDLRCQPTVASFHPALMTVGLEIQDTTSVLRYQDLKSMVPDHDCIAVGPGLGKNPVSWKLVRDIVSHASVPVVVDADGLNSLGTNFGFPESGPPLILTPHVGELNRLVPLDSDVREIQETAAMELANTCRGVVVLKGHRTLISDGTQSVHNATGNPGMATAGSGDVLTGIIAAMIGQGLSIWESAVTGCFVHGNAGDIAASRKSQVSMIATDIMDALPAMFGE